MENARSVGSRFDTDRRTVLVGLVDVVLVAAVVTAGAITHGANPLTEPLVTLDVVAPFVIGWLAVAPLAGLYGTERLTPLAAARLTTLGWLGGAYVGLLLRGGVFGGGTTWPFPLVMAASGLVVLLPWRVAYAALAKRADRGR